MAAVPPTRSYGYLPAIIRGSAFIGGLFLAGRGLKEIYRGIPLQELKTLAGLKTHRAVVYEVGGGCALSVASLALGLVANRTPKKSLKPVNDDPLLTSNPNHLFPPSDEGPDDSLRSDKPKGPPPTPIDSDSTENSSSSWEDDKYFSADSGSEDFPAPTPNKDPVTVAPSPPSDLEEKAEPSSFFDRLAMGILRKVFPAPNSDYDSQSN